MAKFIKGVGIVIGVFIILYYVGEYSYKEESSVFIYEYEQIGYYKGEDKFRIFTFNVDGIDTLNVNSGELKAHASKRMHTSGAITWVFYYSNGNAPNITLMNFNKAYDKCLNEKPIAKVGIMRNEVTKIVLNPTE